MHPREMIMSILLLLVRPFSCRSKAIPSPRVSRCFTTALHALAFAVLAATASAESFYLETPQAPKIPAKTFKLTDYGGVGDGKTLNTAAFAKAIDACKKAGGGIVVVPAGTFITGPIKLVSQMGLLVEKGAIIKASGNLADFGLPDPLPSTQVEIDALQQGGAPLISGSKLTDIAIRGEGTIDGNGVVWWAMAKKAPAWAIPTPAAAALPAAAAQPGVTIEPTATPAPKPRLILDDRPNMIVLRDCQRIHFQGVTFLNPPMFHFVPSRCREILIEDVKVIAPDDSPNSDGIDPSNSSNVLIRRCLIDTGDDNIALKAGGGSPFPTENVTVTDCTFKHGHGVSIGSETQAGIRNVLVQNCTFEGTDNGLRIKSDRTRGGTIENVTYRDIKMKNVAIPITIFLYYDAKKGALSPDFKPVTEKTPIVRNIHFLNVTCDGATKRAAEIVGLPESPASLVKFENVSITNAAAPMTIQDAKSLEMKNVEVTMKYAAPSPTPSPSPRSGSPSSEQQKSQ